MDEHIGLTRRVAQDLLSKAHLVDLLRARDTQAGTAQRIHNCIVQFGELVAQNKTVQRHAFQVAEAAMQMLSKWDASVWRSFDPTLAVPPAVAHLSLLALMLQLCRHRASFSPNQQAHFTKWQAQIVTHLSQGEADVDEDARIERVEQCKQQLHAAFVTRDPFAHLHLAPFTVPGVSMSQLNVRPSSSSPPTSSPAGVVPASSARPVSDVPFAFLPRSICPSCGRGQPFYCTYCYQVIQPMAVGKLPQVELPIQIDIVLHANVLRHKSTALQTLLLCHPRSRVSEHLFSSPLPAFDAATTAVVFPSSTALTVAQLAHHLASLQGSAGAPVTAADSSVVASPSCPLRTLERVVFLEATWQEAEDMLSHPRLRSLTHVRLDFSTESSSSSSITGDSSPCTAFWRFQRFGASFLSSIEAIFHTLQQLQHAGLLEPAGHSRAAVDSDTHRFDNLLWIFAMSYELRVRAHFQAHPQLLPPIHM